MRIMSKEIMLENKDAVISKMKQELKDRDAVLYLFSEIEGSQAYERLLMLYNHLERMIKICEKNEPQRFEGF